MHHHKIAHAVGGATSDFGISDCPLCQAGDGASSTSLKAPSMGEMTSGIGGAALSLSDPSSSGGRLLLNESDIYGGYPMKFLVMVVCYLLSSRVSYLPLLFVVSLCLCCRRNCQKY